VPKIEAIYRYPVKGLSPERLDRVQLTVRQTLPGDRIYAIENGPTGFDPAKPKYQPKSQYLELMRNERLALLRTRFEEASHTLVIGHNGGEVRGDLRTADGRAAVEEFFARFCADELRGPPRVLHAPGFSFSDVAKKVVSVINLASVREVGSAVGAPVDPLRFRGNVYVSGWPAWHEFDLLGREITLGGARLKVMTRIVRCAATNVDPLTAARDLAIPQTLLQRFGHADCGVYAEVIAAGEVATGDAVAS
jgi:uncharacterized protein YcbX